MSESARGDAGSGEDFRVTALETPTANHAQVRPDAATDALSAEPATEAVTAEPVTVPVAAGDPGGPASGGRLPSVRYTSGAAPVPAAVAAQQSRGWLSPTRTDITEPAVRMDFDDDSGRRPGRRRWWIAAAVVILLLAGGVVAVVRLASKQTSPTASVRTYFDDLAAGDTTSAMALVADAATFTAKANPLLSPAAVAQVVDRPSHLTVNGTASTTAPAGGPATAVAVSYSVGATTVHQSITVIGGGNGGGGNGDGGSADGGGAAYLLSAPFMTVSLPKAGRALRVNGIPVPSGLTHTLAFPGAYVATVVGTELIAPITAQAIYNSASGTVEADFSLPAPTVAPGATEVVQKAVNGALDACAGSTSAAPANCPFSYPDSGATLKWAIVTYPQVHVAINGNTVTFDDGGHPGTVHYDASTSVFFGLIPHTDSGTANADATGTATATDTGVTVTFTG